MIELRIHPSLWYLIPYLEKGSIYTYADWLCFSVKWGPK